MATSVLLRGLVFAAAARTVPSNVRLLRTAKVRMGAVEAHASELSAATAELARAHASALRALEESLGMTPVDFAAAYGCERIEAAGVRGSVRSFEAPLAKLAWCSSLSLQAPDGCFATFGLQAWNAPTTDVPHLHVQAGVSDGGIDLSIDFRPRLNAGYERAGADGAFADPQSREEFSQAGLREAYATAFFDEGAALWRAAVCATEGAELVRVDGADVQGRRQFGGTAGVSYGPLRIELRLPLTRAAAAAAAAAVESSAQRWLGWMRAAGEASWMANRMMYDRDNQVRHAVYRADAGRLQARWGAALGLRVAAAYAGRHDMVGHNTLGLGMGHGFDDSDGRD